MTCPHCHARNSPAAFECHNCEAPLRDGPEYLKERAASTWQALARRWGVPALAALLLLGAAHGGDWLGDWYTRQAPVAPLEPGHVVVQNSSLEERYEAWKQAHALPVENLMALYSPQAHITFTDGSPGGVNQLRQLAVQVRQMHSFDNVREVGASRISTSLFGTRATITARHRYGHSSRPNAPSYGNRTLVWEQQNGQWLIVQDDFPTTFSGTP